MEWSFFFLTQYRRIKSFMLILVDINQIARVRIHTYTMTMTGLLSGIAEQVDNVLHANFN
jgi:hypothetical protein